MAKLAPASPRMLMIVINEGAASVMNLSLCFDCLRVTLTAMDPHGCGCPGNIRVYQGVGNHLLPIGHRLLMVLMCHLAWDIANGWRWQPLRWVPPCAQHRHFRFVYADFPPWLDLVPRPANSYTPRMRSRVVLPLTRI